MKHCHCGLRHHFEHFRVKKLGIFGAVLMGLHILFHVVECLVVPSILVALSGHFSEEPAQAADTSSAVVSEESAQAADTSSAVVSEESANFLPKVYSGFCFNNQRAITSIYWQQTYDEAIHLVWPVCE